MSVMLALRCVAPAFAIAGVAAVWFMAGPMAAGLSLVVFLLGVVTSELQHVRWSRVEDAPLSAEAELMAWLNGEAAPARSEAAAAIAAPPQPPKRNFRCTADALAIGSGRDRTGLVVRSRHHAAAAAVRACRKREAALRASLRAAAPAPTQTFRAAYAERLAS